MSAKPRSIFGVCFIAAIAAVSVLALAPAAHATYAGQTLQGPPPPPPPPPPPALNAGPPQSGPAVTAPGDLQPAKRNAGCVWTRRIYDWRRVDDSRIIVRTSPSRQFMVTFNGVCRESRWSNTFYVRRSWGSCLSTGDILVFNRGFFHDRFDDFPSAGCWVSSISQV